MLIPNIMHAMSVLLLQQGHFTPWRFGTDFLQVCSVAFDFRFRLGRKKAKTDTFNKLTSVFFMRLPCRWSWISSRHRQSRCRSTTRLPSGSSHYFDNAMTKFIVNNRTDAWKTDVNLFFTIRNCQIVRSRSLMHRINYKFMCLSAYWQ